MVFDSFASVRLCEQRALLSNDFKRAVTTERAYAASRSFFSRPAASATLLDRLLYADMKTYLVELLMKQDQMSMAASIESRVPFLDHKLVEFGVSLPDSWKLSGLTTKRVLREAMKTVLPASILNRPKMGFPVPLGSWLRDGWHSTASAVLLDTRSRQRGVIDADSVETLNLKTSPLPRQTRKNVVAPVGTACQAPGQDLQNGKLRQPAGERRRVFSTPDQSHERRCARLRSAPPVRRRRARPGSWSGPMASRSPV